MISEETKVTGSDDELDEETEIKKKIYGTGLTLMIPKLKRLRLQRLMEISMNKKNNGGGKHQICIGYKH